MERREHYWKGNKGKRRIKGAKLIKGGERRGCYCEVEQLARGEQKEPEERRGEERRGEVR